jgi:LysM repeat protein
VKTRFRRLFIRLASVFILVSLLLGPAQAQEVELPLLPADPGHLEYIYQRINQTRASVGLPPYNIHPALNAAAQDQAEWLARTGRRSHFRPDGSRPSTRAAAAGYISPFWCCGENYYLSIDATPELASDFWNWSASHVVNVVHPDFTDIGLGMSSNGTRISYVTLFGQTGEQSVAEAVAMDIVVTLPEQTETNANAPAATYTVQAGDTLNAIAARQGVTLAALLLANDISDANLIYAGQVITIPPR